MLRRLFDFLYEKLLSRLGLVLLALTLLVNLGALLAVDRGVTLLDRARASAELARDVTAAILDIQSMLYENDSAQRGFLVTGQLEYLAPLNKNEGKIPARLAKLHDMVADNTPHQLLVERVTTLTQEIITLQKKSLGLQQSGQIYAANAIVIGGEGKKLIQDIEKETSHLLVEEEKLRQERLLKGADIQLSIRWDFAAILFINAMMILIGAVTIMRGMAREVERDRTDLIQQDNREAAELVRQDEREAVSAGEVAQRAAELRGLTAHLLRVHEEERRTVARDLHDELGGTLSAIKLDIIMGRDAAAKRSDVKSVARFQRALTAVDNAVHFVRHLIEDLRPTLLDNVGFEVALRAMADQFSERSVCECVVALPEGELNLTSAQSTALYRICQEALTNVMKYAKAKRVGITLSGDGSQWTLLIVDDGVGLDSTKQHRSISHGLLGMRERTVALGGHFDIRGAAGRGTTLNASFPVGEFEPPIL